MTRARPVSNESLRFGPVSTAEENQNEMRLWKRKALNALGKGRSPAVTFVSDYIPAWQGEQISRRLETATTEAEVKAAFGAEYEPEDPAIKTLIENIKLGIQSLNIEGGGLESE